MISDDLDPDNEQVQIPWHFRPIRVIPIVIVVLAISIAVFCEVTNTRNRTVPAIVKQEPISRYRLPNTTIPLRYDIELITNIHDHESENQFDFEGKVSVTLRVLERNVRSITLHHRQIRVTHVKLSRIRPTKKVVIVDDDSSFSLDEIHELLIIHPPKPLKIGNYVLEIQYRGVLRTDTAGFYRSFYMDANGRSRWIAATQFQSTDARHAFPCYDEPGTRTPIGLKLTHGKIYHAIANMPIKSQVDLNQNFTTTEFEDTPPMQTYLLAFVVSDFDSVSDVQNNQSVYANPTSNHDDLDFALEAGVKVLHALEDYLQVNYSLPKLDQVGIPDFTPDAMENWGLVTYREETLIYNSTRSPMGQLKRTALSIGHEYTHQFFGNLVSPKWWNYLWLNEGFAVLLQYLAAHEAYPYLRIQEMVTTEVVQKAFQYDALETTYAMNFYVETPSDISALFDDVVYEKSASVLRQIQHAVGDSVFRAGLKYYLDAKQFQAATSDDLAEGLQKSVDEHDALPSNVKVLDIINSWADQDGYPLLHVTRGVDNVVRLRQERYLLKPSEDTAKATWYLPYNLATSRVPNFSSTQPLGWLIGETAELRPSPSLNWDIEDWIVFNKQQTGYYRVKYDDNLWELIIHKLLHGDHKSIHHLNRAQLIDDSLNLARSGHLKYDVALRLVQYLSVEQEYVPWASLNNGLSYLNRMLTNSTKYVLFKQYVWKLVEPSFRKFGLANKPDDTHLAKLTRNILINWACQIGAGECLTKISAQLAQVVSNKTEDIDPNLKSVVYCNGLRNADRDTFLFVLDRMNRSQYPSDRVLLISALGCSQNSELLQLYLKTSLDEASYRGQERSGVLSAVYTNGKVGLEVAMKFLTENAETIDRLYNGESLETREIGSAVTKMGKQIVDQEQYNKFEAMNTKLAAAQYLNNVERSSAKNLARENIRWRRKYYAIIEGWLDQHFKSRVMRF